MSTQQWTATEEEAQRGQRRGMRRRGLIALAAGVAATLVARTRIADAQAPAQTTRVLYDMQSPDVWFEDFGEGTLTNGKAEVAIAADFGSAVNTAQYHVFLTAHDPASNGLAVASRGPARFGVQEHGGGTSNTTFSWRLVARPKAAPVGARDEFLAMADRLPSAGVPAQASGRRARRRVGARRRAHGRRLAAPGDPASDRRAGLADAGAG